MTHQSVPAAKHGLKAQVSPAAVALGDRSSVLKVLQNR